MNTEVDDEALILGEIQDKYVPFLKKLIAFLEKNQKVTPDNLNRLKSIYTVFTTSSISEQIDTFKANKKKLEKWYKNPKKDNVTEDTANNSTTQGVKRSLVVDDNDSSQGASDAAPSKRGRTEVQNAPQFLPAMAQQIKQEKVDSTPAPSPPPSDDGPVMFMCASCQFQSHDEQEFMKHTRTDHRSDLSMWCKQCGRCFSNAGVLVMHIKSRQCNKEDMIYRCGVKECTFETTSGQTFVHHLRHCHKGSPFIFCIHCQKIFTLPHCLILHMQDDCPFKERNRKDPSTCVSQPPAPVVQAPVAAVAAAVPAPVPERPSFSQTPTIASVTSGVAPNSIRGGLAPKSRGGGLVPSSRGRSFRGRGRGRGRGRPPSDDSDSDDPDDPMWKPEELPESAGLRRSGRFAKKLNDAVTAAPKAAKKSLTSEELKNASNMVPCPCCDYTAAFESVLHDHYIAQHKIANKNGCSECLLKFESTQCFIEHFKYHSEGKLPTSQEAASAAVTLDNGVDHKKVSENSNDVVAAAEPVKVVVTPEVSVPPAKVVIDEELMNGVVQNLSEVDVIDPTSEEAQCIKIPYQAAIHDKSSKDGKLKRFEDLKSQSDLAEMRKPEKLRSFYRCAIFRCPFTSHDDAEFSSHCNKAHSAKMIRCAYCLKDFFSGNVLVEHMMEEHSKRIFQCSGCFYRACTSKHVRAHIQHCHADRLDTEIIECEPVKLHPHITLAKEPTENTTWPYICAIGDCVFQSFDPKQFRQHNEAVHRTVSVFFCHYCKVDFISFHRLLDHHRLHGINALQCNYCIHGAETREDILLHLCNAHADLPMKAFKRGLDEAPNSVPISMKSNNNTPAGSPRPESPVEKNLTDFESLLYEVVGETYYPKFLKSMATDFVCGVPACREKFEGMLIYIGHLRNHHAAVNFPCPHCPRISDDWAKFKNHLLCHGPNLYACGLVTCSFFDHSKNVVTEHLKSHSQSTAKVVIVREEESPQDDIDTVKSLPESYSANVSDTSYQCLFCLFKSSDKNIMKNHLYNEVLYKRFSCNLCNEKHVSRKDIKNHFVEKHPDQDIKCSVHPDPSIEHTVQRFLDLKIETSEVKSGQCVSCKKNFKTVFHLQQHMYLCTRKQYQPFDCNHCKSSFHDLKVLKFHIDEKHFREPFLFTEISSQLVEEALTPKLQKTRLELLTKAVSKDSETSDAPPVKLIKFYTCSACSYESNHKHNTQLHIKNEHKDSSAQTTKVLRNVDMPDLPVAQPPKEDSSSSKKPYRCTFCIKRAHTLEELEKHVETSHVVREESKYDFYYSPDAKTTNLASDDRRYECSYCNSGADSLAALKTHQDFMHADSPFRVRGTVYREQDWAPVACAYCYQRMASSTELKQHNLAAHPALPQKSVGGFRSTGPPPQQQKRPLQDNLEDETEVGNKRVRFPNSVFICGHCGSSVALRGQMTGHCKKAHARLQAKFTEEDEGDRTFLQCEFCTFTAEQPALDTHLLTKHKSRVTCGHCPRRFEFVSRLKEHHDQAHKGATLKYSQETLVDTTVKDRPKRGTSTKRNAPDLFINTWPKKGAPSKRLALSAFETTCDLHPKVVLRKINSE